MENIHRITDSTKSKLIDFGNFKYGFNRYTRTMWNDNNTREYINEIQIYTCDSIPVMKWKFSRSNAEVLYRKLGYLKYVKDSFYIQLVADIESTEVYGSVDPYSSTYYINIEKKNIYSDKTSSIRLSMNEEDYYEFVDLFFFHFLIEYAE